MPPGADAPSVSDGFVRTLSAMLGGPIGRHASGGGSWWTPTRYALATAVVMYVIGILQKLPCRIGGADQYLWMCYSDIPLLYGGRGLAEGNTPYLDTGGYPVLEYPVGTGYFIEIERLITVALGAPTGLGLTQPQIEEASLIFFYVNVVLLAALFLVTVWAVTRTVAHRPWDAMMLAASPCVALTALINWDLLPVALTALACMFWSRRQPGAAGIMLGLGMAVKLYPVLLLGPLLLLCLRGRKMPEFGTTAAAFVVTWGLTNLPILLLAPKEWLNFWTFNSDRGGDFGSIWYVLSLAGHEVGNLNMVNAAIFIGACLAIGLLIMFAPRRPRFGSVAFLVVAAFLMTNKVYSPQYVLWLLPLLILAWPKWRDWVIFTAGELIYFAGIWWHLGGQLAPGDGGPDRLYWLAVIIRLATEAWVVIMVVRSIVRPETDVVRGPGIDDPGGGVLDGAPDAGWLPRHRSAEPRRVAG